VSAAANEAFVVRPKNIKPIWAAVPLLTLMANLGILPTSEQVKK